MEQEHKKISPQKNLSFFDAPLPRYAPGMFKVDPAIIGKQLQRPSRPITQVSRYSQKTMISMAPGEMIRTPEARFV